ncbi:MAG: SusD/RagB family nutrient-binding outer membrane lipoprotein [Candidatus Brocadiales bacterium]|nr:SusD/RagB family nutrient-binding outer membrane lipoprotein [Candidatus Brocadiales bacterium]
MKKILIILMAFLVIASCTKLEDLNENTKNPTEVPGVTLFSNAQKSLADQIASTNVNMNVFKIWAQYWTETTYTDEANYDIINRTIADNVWREWYRDVLMDLKEAGIIIAATEYATADETAAAANQLVIIDIMEVFVYERMVTLWGNIPYTEALDIDNVTPAYDDGLTIYKNLITRIDADIAALNTAHGSFGNADLVYHGDVGAWKKFANTLKLKMGTVLSDVDPGLASSTILAAIPGAFTSNADNAEFVYLATTPNTNPLYVDLTLSGRQDFIGTTIITDYMVPWNDPRLPAYFTFAPDTEEYLGGVYGASNPYVGFSHVADAIAEDPTFPCLLLSYVEVEFYLAEAAARANDADAAETHYNAGITASFDYWGVAGAADYLLTPAVAYTTATGTWQEKIATQAWIAFYNNGYEGWTEWRRLDYPNFHLPPDTDLTEVPTRFTYPVFEQTLNGANYTAAASAIGGDLLTTKLFFDKH